MGVLVAGVGSALLTAQAVAPQIRNRTTHRNIIDEDYRISTRLAKQAASLAAHALHLCSPRGDLRPERFWRGVR